MTDLAAGLRALLVYAETLPPGTVIPVSREVLLELAAGQGGAVQTSATPPADLTVADICTRVGRKPSAVRGWLDRGELEGYKFNGREWRVTPAALEAYITRQQHGAGKGKPAAEVGDLGAWRRWPGPEGVQRWPGPE